MKRPGVAIVVLTLMATLAAACSSDSSTPDKGSPVPRPVANVFTPCSGPMGEVPPSQAVDTFAPGRQVDSILNKELALQRDAIALDPALVRAAAADLKAPQVDGLQRDLLEVPAWSHGTVTAVAAPAITDCARTGGEVLTGVLGALAIRTIDSPTNPQPAVEDPRAGLAPTEPLLNAFREVFAVSAPWPHRPTSAPMAEAEPAINALATALGPDSEKALATVIRGMARAEAERLDALKRIENGTVNHADLAAIWASGSASESVVRRFDVATMSRAGVALALAVEKLKARLVDVPLPASIDFRLPTPLGEVIINGGEGNDTIASEAPALIVDQGGNDTYNGVVAGPAMESVPLSAVIDIGGDDTYAGAGRTQGSGVMSFGFLLDHAGNDRYQGAELAQGGGFMGVGVLFDEGGNDFYTARTSSQGSGQLGLGVAVDGAGRDTWRITSQGQGYGGVKGSGLLLDVADDDSYEADDSDITNPSAQSAEHNTSLAQGAGFGARGGGGGGDGAGLGGGTGLLVDLAGNDRYSCGVFCQGAGYYFGQGILYDGSGADAYRGVWYVQGSAAHYALGTLIDESGNDYYATVIKGSRGEGHDESAGFFLDGAGDDTYTVASLSNGAANNVGYGFAVDLAGADTYNSVDLAEAGRFGQVVIDGDFANYRGYDHARSVAVFLDLGGDDRYPDAPAGIANGATWKLPGAASYKLGVAAPPAEQVSVGQDAGS